jgi:hypothetical protein
MLGHQISILQANVGARPGPIMSIFNDDSTATFDAMCISEPYIFAHPRTGEPADNQHSEWTTVTGIQFVRQGDAPSSAVTFFGFSKDEMMEQYMPGLELDGRGPPGNRRLTRITYHGRDAGLVLKNLALHAILITV